MGGKSQTKKELRLGDVPGARRIIFVAISDIEGESQWGAQYDALLPTQPARETIWKCLRSLENNSENRFSNILSE